MHSHDELTRTERRFTHDRRKNVRLWSSVITSFIAIAIAALVYTIFFRIHDVGPRTLSVNGESVTTLEGFKIHSQTWFSREQVQTFLNRIDVPATKFSDAKTYQGNQYIRATDVVSLLQKAKDRSQFSGKVLSVGLRSNQHYSYQSHGDLIRQQEIWVNGRLAGRVLAVFHAGANYIPAKATAQLLTQAGMKSSWNEKVMSLDGVKASTPQIPLQKTDAFRLIAFGSDHSIYAPMYQWQHQTYIPTYSLSNALSQLHFAYKIGPWKWTITQSGTQGVGSAPSQTSTKQEADVKSNAVVSVPAGSTTNHKPMTMAFVPSFYAGDLVPLHDVIKHAASYNALAEDVWNVTPTGELTGQAPDGVASDADRAGDKAYAMIANSGNHGFDAAEMTTILTNSGNFTRLENQIENLVESEGFAGAMLDFETIPPSDRDAFTRFVSQLAARLHAAGKQLQVAVPAQTGVGNEQWDGAYDQGALGQAADAIVVMAYDYSYAGGPAGPIAPVPWMEQVLAYTESRVPARKVILGVDAYGYDWGGKQTIAVSLPNVKKFLTTHDIHSSWNSTAEAPWFHWTDSQGQVHTVYYENTKSIAAKLQLSHAYGTAGVAVWRAGLETNGILKELSQYAKGAKSSAKGKQS